MTYVLSTITSLKMIITIYPDKLRLKKENKDSLKVSFLNISVEIYNRKVTTELFNKKYTFPFIVCRIWIAIYHLKHSSEKTSLKYFGVLPSAVTNYFFIYVYIYNFYVIYKNVNIYISKIRRLFQASYISVSSKPSKTQ